MGSAPQSCLSIEVGDGQHAVDGRLVLAGELAHHHLGRAPVVAEDGIGRLLALDVHDVAQLHDLGGAGERVGRHWRRQRLLGDGEVPLGQLHGDLHGIAPAALVRVADRRAAEVGGDGVVDVLLLHLVELEVVLVDLDAQPRRLLAEAHVVVDDEGHGVEDFAHLARDLAALIGIGAVDLGEQRGDDGRPRRHLDHLEGRAFGRRQSFETLAHVERDLRGWCGGARPWARD